MKRIALLYAACSLAHAQVGTSTLTGRVTDPSGAVVPKVGVTIVRKDTNFAYSSATNEEGLYRVLSLQPGAYRLTFESDGFKKLVRDNIDVRTGDTLAVDAVLQVGSVAESVEVKAAAALLETETSATGSVMEGSTLYKLPQFQRFTNSTFNLVAGITTNGYAYGENVGQYHVAGQRSGSIGMFEDGVTGNDQLSGTGTMRPLLNSVAEVKILTTALPAEYGHSAGGVISVVKKSGTNTFHGMASGYGRSRRMQHRLYFDKFRTTQPSPGFPNGVPTSFMQPDATANGPVYIPKVYDGRNRTFFSFGYMKMIEKKIAQVTAETPTAEMKLGDFNFGGLGNSIFDPLSTRRLPNGDWARDPFPNRIVPQGRIDPVARRILDLDPWVPSNQPGSFNANGPVSNLLANESARVFRGDWNLRVDHQVSQALKLYWSYTQNRKTGYGRPINIRIPEFDHVSGNNDPTALQNQSLGKTWVINPTTVNDARVGYLRFRSDRFVPSYGQDWGKKLGIPNLSPDLLPALGSGNRYAADSLYGISGASPLRNVNETLSFRDDLSKVRGTHAFKMGYELLRHRLNSTVTNRPSGAFFFDGMTAGLQTTGNAQPRTGNTFAGFLTGSVRQAVFDGELTSWLPRSSIHSFYIQDDWKVTPKLTLNIGVRYSNESPFTTKYGFMSNFDPSAVDDVTGRRGAIAHPTGGLNARDGNNFQPRIGLAWHPVEKWVIRAGLALNTIDIKFPQSRGQFEEYVATANQQRDPGDPRPIYQISRGPDPVKFNIRPNGTSGFLGTNYGSRSSEWWDPSLRNPYALNWNLSVQRQLGANYLLEGMYQASAGVALLERWETNAFPVDFAAGNPALRNQVFAAPQNYRPYTQFGNIRFRSNMGHSTFHSGTIKLEKRMSGGLLFNTFYTFSKSIDSQDTDNEGSGVAPIQNRRLEKGRAGFDRNHRWIGVVTYELPMGQGKRWMNRGGWWNRIFGGYEVALIQTAESGNPLSFGFAASPFNYYPTYVGSQRPNLVSTPQLRDNWRDLGGDRFNQNNINPIVDINHFAYPAAFTPGNAGRNTMTGTPLHWAQVSAQKNIRIGERVTIQVRWDMQNAYKTWNFDPPTTAVNFQNPQSFGKLSSDPRTSSLGGQPIQHLTMQLTW